MDHDSSLNRLVDRILEVSRPTRIVLFGSRARGDADPDSDYDLVVVLPSLRSRREETVRLHRAIADLRLPVDILVTTEAVWEEWRQTPGTALHEAATEGCVLYEQAA